MCVNPNLTGKEFGYFNKLAARHHVVVGQSSHEAPNSQSNSSYLQGHTYTPYGHGGGGNFNFSSSSATASVFSGGNMNVRDTRELANDRRNGTAAVVFGLGMIALAGVFAFVTKDYSEKSANLEEANDIKKDLKKENRWENPVKEIVKAAIKFDEKELSKSRQIVAVTATLLATAAVGFTAGMLGVSWLVTASIITGVFTLAIGAFLGARRCIDKENVLPDYAQTGLKELLEATRHAYNEKHSEAV
jgi:hypothetical protein